MCSTTQCQKNYLERPQSVEIRNNKKEEKERLGKLEQMLSFTLSFLPIANEDNHGMGDGPPSQPLCILPEIKCSRKCVEKADSSNICASNARRGEGSDLLTLSPPPRAPKNSI